MLKRIFTIIIILSPLLYIYQTSILTLTLADIALFLILPFIIMDTIKHNRLKESKLITQFVIILIYMVVQILFVYFFNTNDVFEKILMPTLRLLFYYTIIAIFLPIYFDTEKGFKFYKNVVLVASIFLILQFAVLKLTGEYIPGYISNLPGAHVSQSLENHANNVKSTGRVRGFFNEPSHFAIYCSLYLAIDLIAISKKINFTIIITTIAMFLSTSSTAILLVIIFYGIYFLKNIKKILSNYALHFIVALIIFAIIFTLYSRTKSYKSFIDRTFIEKTATENRFENYSLVFDNSNLTLAQKTFGNGILKIEEYIPSIPRIFSYFGYVGLVYFFYISIKNIKRFKGVNRMSTILTVILSFPTEFLFGTFILLYAPFIYLNFDKILEENNNINNGDEVENNVEKTV